MTWLHTFNYKPWIDRVITAMLMILALPVMVVVGLAILVRDGRPFSTAKLEWERLGDCFGLEISHHAGRCREPDRCRLELRLQALVLPDWDGGSGALVRRTTPALQCADG